MGGPERDLMTKSDNMASNHHDIEQAVACYLLRHYRTWNERKHSCELSQSVLYIPFLEIHVLQ